MSFLSNINLNFKYNGVIKKIIGYIDKLIIKSLKSLALLPKTKKKNKISFCFIFPRLPLKWVEIGYVTSTHYINMLF